MNGDFLSLLSSNPFSGLTVGENCPQLLEATTVFAFHFSEGVVMAGDHRATAGNVVFSDRTEKIIELDNQSLIAIAGSPAVAFEMARTLQTTFEFYRRSQLQVLSLPAKVRALSRLLRDNLPGTLQGVGAVAPLFAGREPDGDSPPGIYYYDPLGAQFEAAGYAASGSGSGSIRSVLHYLTQWGNPRPEKRDRGEAINLANRLLLTAAQFDTATGGVDPSRQVFATIRLLTADGIHTVTEKEQAAAWKKGGAND